MDILMHSGYLLMSIYSNFDVQTTILTKKCFKMTFLEFVLILFHSALSCQIVLHNIPRILPPTQLWSARSAAHIVVHNVYDWQVRRLIYSETVFAKPKVNLSMQYCHKTSYCYYVIESFHIYVYLAISYDDAIYVG